MVEIQVICVEKGYSTVKVMLGKGVEQGEAREKGMWRGRCWRWEKDVDECTYIPVYESTVDTYPRCQTSFPHLDGQHSEALSFQVSDTLLSVQPTGQEGSRPATPSKRMFPDERTWVDNCHPDLP
jgi:hypothetical protein